MFDLKFDKTSVFMMRGPSYRGKRLDTYSVEAVPQATKQRGARPMGVWEETVTDDGRCVDNSG
ncbi:MAG: hypothetical protein IJI12_04125 [Atopobiaceae bacterium]|nr:hypothetical protein [Atopobiaceae bacterium]